MNSAAEEEEAGADLMRLSGWLGGLARQSTGGMAAEGGRKAGTR